MHAGPFADAQSPRGRRKQTAYLIVFGRETGRERGDDHVTRASGATDRGHEIGCDGQHEHRGKRDSRHGIDREVHRERETGERRDQKSRDRFAGRDADGGESHSKGHGLEHGGERQHEIVRQSEHGKAAEPKQKTPDFDLGCGLPLFASGQDTAGDDLAIAARLALLDLLSSRYRACDRQSPPRTDRAVQQCSGDARSRRRAIMETVPKGDGCARLGGRDLPSGTGDTTLPLDRLR